MNALSKLFRKKLHDFYGDIITLDDIWMVHLNENIPAVEITFKNQVKLAKVADSKQNAINAYNELRKLIV